MPKDAQRSEPGQAAAEPRHRPPLRMAATLALAAAGGALAMLAGLPLPWLIGALLTLAIAGVARLRILGGPPAWPQGTRSLAFPIIGAMVGASFTAETLAQAAAWWPSLAALTVFVLLALVAVYALMRRVGGYDHPTAFFAALPGGFIEAAILGRAAGGQERLIVLQQFLRIFMIVLLIPLIFWAISGRQVGSASGIAFGEEAGGMPGAEVALLAGLCLLASQLGKRLRLPASEISAAILASAVLHATDLVGGAIPFALIAGAQLLIGTTLGVGFVGLERAELVRGLGLALSAFVIVLSLGLAFAFGVSAALGLDTFSVLLAFTPGGLAEMSLVALSLQLSVPFVILMHLYRIVFTVLVIPQIYRLVTPR